MKVYELINELSKCPAGADVEFSTEMTLAEFASRPVVDNVDDADLYNVSGAVKDVDVIGDSLVSLHM